MVLVGGQEEPGLPAGDAEALQLPQVAVQVHLEFGAGQQRPAVRRPRAVEPVPVGMGTHVMALGQHPPDQRRELGVAQEVAGEEERGLGSVPGQCLQDGFGSLRKLMAGEHQRQLPGGFRTADDGAVLIGEGIAVPAGHRRHILRYRTRR